MRCVHRILVLVLPLAAACAGRPPARVIDDTCLLRGPEGVPSDGAYRIAAAPDRLVLGRTLVEVDCHGGTGSGLADVSGDEGRRRVLTLRDGARLENGAPLTAHDVARIWSEVIARGGGVDSVRAVDHRRIEVFLELPEIATLASPDFSITTGDAAGWHLLGVPSDFRAEWLSAADVMIVDDAAFAEYAAEKGMATAPLPYDRTLVLLVPGARGSPRFPPEACLDLATAVRTARVRASTTAPWWRDGIESCAELPAMPGRRGPVAGDTSAPPSVYYDAGDPVARDLAERIVALAAVDTARSAAARAVMRVLATVDGAFPVAVGLPGEAMSQRLENGDALAFVTSVRNPVADVCGSARSLVRRAPWLSAGGRAVGAGVIPLVDTHGFLILTRRDIAATWDIYGTVRVVPTPELP